VFWIIVFLACIAGTIYLIYYSVNTYVQYSEVTSTSIKYDAVTQFPTITICSLNPYFLDALTPTSTFEQLNNYSFYSQNFYGFNGSDVTLNNTLAPVRLQDLVASVKYSEYNRMYQLSQQLGPANLLAMFRTKILSCTYMGVSCNLQSDFQLYTNIDNLFCFKFNNDVNNIKTSAKAGPSNSLQLRLFLGSSRKLVIAFCHQIFFLASIS
jgi:hypothetical protein